MALRRTMMSDDTSHDDTDFQSDEARQGPRGADVLAVLAVSSFLAAVGLITFFVTTAIAG